MNTADLDWLKTEFDRVWPWIESGLQHDLGGSTHNKEEIWEMISSGQAQVWSHPRCRGAILTMKQHYPRSCDLLLWSIGADVGGLKYLARYVYPSIETWAREIGIQNIVGLGREQWTGFSKRMGFRPVQVLLAKKL